jgi:DNA-binding SARP family transcriptional activator/tetratricopeptide (TPR) repeat protein
VSRTAEIKLLGTFEVALDGHLVASDQWPRRQAASLVKVLALSPGRQRHREQLIDLMWPDLSVAEAAPRLHKLAHYARVALGGDRRAVVLRGETVALLPDVEVVVDVDVFEALADAALSGGSPAEAAAAAAAYGGTLLPGDLYEPWAERRREQLRLRYIELLRRAGQWDRLLTEDATDEEANLALMNGHVADGDHLAALRQFERLDAALRHELGVAPSRRVLAVRDRVLGALSAQQPDPRRQALVGRSPEQKILTDLLTDAGHGAGRTVLVSGSPGIGKTALLDWAREQAKRNGWRIGHGVAAAIEGAWPYAPVLDAFSDLCRQHPALLDGLNETFRVEIDRGLAGHELTWNGEGTHQRLFVAVAELLRLAAAGTGLLLAIDDMHESDEASLRLLHYLARSVTSERSLIIVGYRTGGGPQMEQIKTSLLRRNMAIHMPLRALSRASADALVRAELADASAKTLDDIWEVSGGLPFAVIEMARASRSGTTPRGAAALGLDRLAVKTREALQRVAIIGTSFDTDEFVALTGLPEPEAYAALDAALAAYVVVHTGSGFRFRHALIRDALLDDIAPAQQRAFHHRAASGLQAIGGAPGRIAHHLIAAGRPSDAVRYVVQAVETEAAVGAYRDALSLVEAVRDHASPADHARLLALRADLLSAIGDRATILAYREALAVAAEPDRPLLRARMGNAAAREGDLDTAAVVLDGLEPDGGPADAAILLAQGNLAYFSGDIDGAGKVAEQVGGLLGPDDTWQRLDLLTLQALVAHHRGELFSRLRLELRRAHDTPALASAVFDPYLCVVEFLLYGTTPYSEVKSLATSLRDTARRTGILRAEAFASALLGKAALLTGNLVEAKHELQDAADLHREAGAPGGEASSLQRLAELRLLQGDRDEATRLLRQALLLARWSIMAPHLVQRIFGTMILAAADPHAARIVVDQAAETMSLEDRCSFCDIMLAVPSAIACADVGDVEDAYRHLAVAERSSQLWEGTSWQGAILEARAHISLSEGDPERAADLLEEAAKLFTQAGQPLDAARCQAGLETPVGAHRTA